MRYSFIIPVYNRPDEVDELLQSLLEQTFRDFEVIVVEDGSSVPCRDVTLKYADRLDLHYYTKPNSGPGQTRNYGAERSHGEYLIILDSDVVLPPGFLAVPFGDFFFGADDALITLWILASVFDGPFSLRLGLRRLSLRDISTGMYVNPKSRLIIFFRYET